MRKIEKSKDVPATLVGAPVPTSANKVDKNIYGAADVRDQLEIDQHYKCAYCECYLPLKYHDVEHFRPKAHYYWLGHEWKNLLYSCERCNRTFKNDSFPLKNEAARANSPHDNIKLEHPLLINPAETDPSIHIKFRRHEAIGLTPEGAKTIEFFHLNDGEECPELLNNRKQLFEQYSAELANKQDIETILGDEALSENIRNTLSKLLIRSKQNIDRMTSLDTPFSGMLISQYEP